MQHNTRWLAAGLIITGLLSACGQTPAATVSKPEPAEVKPIEGTDLNQVTLVAQAAQRLNIQTTAVRDEQVTRKRTVGGEVVTSPGATTSGNTSRVASASKVWVRVPLSVGDLDKIDRGQPAMILPLVKTADTTGVSARLDRSPAANGTEANQALYYTVEGTKHNLTPGSRVRVELVLAGSGMQRTVIPYSSLIYDLHGDTWIYTSPAPLTFVRERVTVDYIDGDNAILAEGPGAGTEIVSVGVAELYGTEFGVGH